MTMKKSLIAVAVAGAVGAPLSAAQAAEAYGFVNVGIDTVSKDGGGAGCAWGCFPTADIVFGAGNDGSTHMSDTAESRFGFKGSEDLGNGLTAGYRFEFGIGTDAFGGGSVNEDSGVNTRLSNVSISGDFGTLSAGTQWGAIYDYLGWNVFRSHQHGGAGYYYATRALEFSPAGDGSGLRVMNSIKYTWGAGGYGSDPFTFTVQGQLAPDSGTGASENDELLDSLTVAGMATFGDFQVNALSYQENDSSGAPEPSLTGIGGRWNAGDLYVGGNFTVTDLDVAGADDLEVLQLLATYDFGGGNSGMAGVSTGDSGNINQDLSGVFLQFQHNLSASTVTYIEVESATVDNSGVSSGGGVTDGETTVVSLNMKHSF